MRILAEHTLDKRARQDLHSPVRLSPHVCELWVDRDRRVGYERPGCRRPDQELIANLRRPGRLGDGKPHIYRRVDHVLVDVGLAELVARQRGAAARAVGDDLELLVQQPLLVDRLQRPPDRLDVRGIERPVGVVEIDPEPDPLCQPVPLLDVAEHLLAAAGVELGDPVALDVLLGLHPQLGLDRQLDREAVAVPAALALDVVPGHRPVAREDVLEHPAQDVVGAGVAVGGRWALIEAPLRRALASHDRLLEDLAVAPALAALRAPAQGTKRAGLRGGASGQPWAQDSMNPALCDSRSAISAHIRQRSHSAPVDRDREPTEVRSYPCATADRAAATATIGRERVSDFGGASLASSASRAATGDSPSRKTVLAPVSGTAPR